MDDSIPYRVEYAKTGRAGCKGSAVCKKNGVKILKSELRFGTYVENDFIQGWQWRHWGCVTPKVLSNVSQKIDGDFDLLDGFEDLFESDQEKVKKAISSGAIDLEDVTSGLVEEVQAMEAEKEAKAAQAEAKRLEKVREKEEKKAQKEREKEEKKAQKEREKEEKKTQKERAKEEKKAQKEEAKASKAKKRKRGASESDLEDEHAVPAAKRKVKQEGDAAHLANSKVKREAAPAKAKGKKVKEEPSDSQPAKVKKEEDAVTKPNKVKRAKKATNATAKDLDGAVDETPQTGKGKATTNGKVSTALVRRSTRNKR